jgi:hypothetical protein
MPLLVWLILGGGAAFAGYEFILKPRLASTSAPQLSASTYHIPTGGMTAAQYAAAHGSPSPQPAVSSSLVASAIAAAAPSGLTTLMPPTPTTKKTLKMRTLGPQASANPILTLAKSLLYNLSSHPVEAPPLGSLLRELTTQYLQQLVNTPTHAQLLETISNLYAPSSEPIAKTIAAELQVLV